MLVAAATVPDTACLRPWCSTAKTVWHAIGLLGAAVLLPRSINLRHFRHCDGLCCQDIAAVYTQHTHAGGHSEHVAIMMAGRGAPAANVVARNGGVTAAACQIHVGAGMRLCPCAL